LTLTKFSRWRISVVALVHVGIVALRLSIAALARRVLLNALATALLLFLPGGYSSIQ